MLIQAGKTCLFNFGQFSEDCDRRRWVHTTVIDGSQPFILTQFMTIDLTIANNWRIYWTDMKRVAASNLRAVSLFRGLYARVARNLDMDVSLHKSNSSRGTQV